MNPNTISALSLLVSAISLVVSFLSSRRQEQLETKIHESESRLQKEVHSNELTLQRRSSFFDLWPHVAHLNQVDPTNPIQVDVIKAVNALEMIAICWEANVVDREVIRVSMLDSYLSMHDSINQIAGRLPNGKNGPEVLRASPIVGKVYNSLLGVKHGQSKISGGDSGAAAASS